MSKSKTAQLMIAVPIGTVCAYFAVSLFTYFYTSAFSFVALSLILSFAFFTFVFFLADELIAHTQAKWRTELIGILVLLLAVGFVIATLRLCLQFPTLFNRRVLFMDAFNLPLFAALTIVSAVAGFVFYATLLKRGALDSIRNSRAFGWIRDNLAGLLLSSLFFLIYFSLAETINFPGFRTLDQYFDLDISAWLTRFQATSPREITDTVRAVHPAVLLFLRPLTWIASLLLNGDRLHAAFIVHALVAAACVFLMWKIVRRVSSNSSYALLAATLLGASASHLLLGSMLETYIYSALALLVFVSFLQNDVVPFKSAVLTGIVVFGITVTNLVQTVILYFSKQPNVKTILRYFIIVLAAVFVLNRIQAWLYPAAQVILPSTLRAEQGYQVNLTEKPWLLTGRVSLVARALLFYGIVAPRPFVLMEELGMSVPNFRTFKITIGEFQVAGYTGLGDVIAKIWLLILVAAFVFFALAWFEKQKPILALGLLACMGFNFAMHIVYGDDPMLYSPDWVYALILFVAFSFGRYADRKWLQISFIAFLLPLMIVNLNLVRQIMEVSVPFYGR